jgi:hypothetical protein
MKLKKMTKMSIAPPTWHARCCVLKHEHQGGYAPLDFWQAGADETPSSP